MINVGIGQTSQQIDSVLPCVRQFSNRSQMTSKCSKNKTLAHEAIADGITDALTTF